MAGRADRALTVHATGPLTTVQDLGRAGRASIGVGHSGAADPGALRLANRLLGNDEGTAALEVTLGGLVLEAHGDLVVAVTGAPCPLRVGDREAAAYGPVHVPDGARLRLETPEVGLRSYLAVRGGLAVPPVLGSRATDTLSGVGPERLVAGVRLPVGSPVGPLPGVDLAPVRRLPAGDVTLRVVPGPREDWFTADALAALLAEPFEVTAESDRIGMRLAGPRLERSREEELPSEGMVCGALQVPPSGSPTLFLADHPVTGGYPVIAVVTSADLGAAAQTRPGQRLRFVATT